MSILDNERFNSKFTHHLLAKLIIAIDEGFIPSENKRMQERIKSLSTATRVWYERKGCNPQELNNYTKLILCSNDENNFNHLRNEEETRYAIIKVPGVKQPDPDLLSKMAKEIPAFIHFLLNGDLYYIGNQSRFWFASGVYTTPLIINIDQVMTPLDHEEMKRRISMLSQYKLPDWLEAKIVNIVYNPTGGVKALNNGSISKPQYRKYDKENFPKIITLCGAAKFFKEFEAQNYRLTLEGNIVLSIGCNTKSDEGLKLSKKAKANLDELHKRKIDLSNEIFVLNVGGYIGESTAKEIAYATATNKVINYLEPLK